MTHNVNHVSLDDIHSPDDLKKVRAQDLPILAEQLRRFLYETLNQTGGHFAAGLGVVELTLALHYVFKTPEDKIIWDVGHQAYPHKILTERQSLLHTIRQKDGLAPFPVREESPYDVFGVGHSSTSISAACGMAQANQLLGKSDKVIAVIGDGAMTAGMAFEALNHAGDLKSNMLVILNDNDMSISGNVGALSNYFARILSSKMYTSMKQNSKRVLSRIPPVWEFARKTESHLKGMIAPGTLFEELGWNYLGPIDGHDIPTLLKTLSNLKALPGPQLLHVITQKGKGYPLAEQDPIKYHAVNKGFYKSSTSCSQSSSSTSPSTEKSMPSYSDIFGAWLCEMAEKDDRIVGITPAMCEGSGMVNFKAKFPNRYFDVGIAEQHSVTFAAGLACENIKPVVAIYSTFLQRAYDQLIHDVALQNLPVLFALDRAGLVGDGPTHSGSFDLSFLRCIPNMIIMAPSDANECRHMLYTGIVANSPSAVRYPRGSSHWVELDKELKALPLGKGEIKRQGKHIAILSFGSLLQTALEVGDELNTTVVNMRFVKPLDEALILQLAETHSTIVTLEENVVIGGAGQGVSACLNQHGLNVKIINLGLPDYFVSHGDPKLLLASCGLDKKAIIHRIMQEEACQKVVSTVNS
ncbi:MAG: 1-deoxy-D-xylulose-5-phosphate synthase [Candidatus Berkiella sp.]